jgi:hypothetical protein
LLHVLSFSLPLFIFFPPNDISWYFPSPWGYFPIFRPLHILIYYIISLIKTFPLHVLYILTHRCR